MNNDEVDAYDKAAAKLQSLLSAAYPEYKWYVPDTWQALNHEGFSVMQWANDGWLVVYIKDGAYAAWMRVTRGVEHDAAAVKVIGQGLIDHMNTYRG